jgi:hypothetical protein
MNARSPERLAAEPIGPAATLELKELGPAARRAFHYQAAEQNRALLENWCTAQLIFAAILLLFLIFGTTESKAPLALAAIMLVVTAVQRVLLAPEMNALGSHSGFCAGQCARRRAFHVRGRHDRVLHHGGDQMGGGRYVSREAASQARLRKRPAAGPGCR